MHSCTFYKIYLKELLWTFQLHERSAETQEGKRMHNSMQYTIIFPSLTKATSFHTFSDMKLIYSLDFSI